MLLLSANCSKIRASVCVMTFVHVVIVVVDLSWISGLCRLVSHVDNTRNETEKWSDLMFVEKM